LFLIGPVTHLSTLISCNMKRVQSVADIYTSNDNDGDQCGDSTVFTQVKRRQYKKSMKTRSIRVWSAAVCQCQR